MKSWVLEAENLSKTFAWVPVLRNVSCRIAQGESVAIFGPNGAGKTTFLRLLATLLTPSSGTLRLFEHAADDLVVRRKLGFLGHDSFLYPDLTPVENLTFYGKAYGLSDVRSRIASVLQFVGLQDWGDTPVRTFSRGMEQRAALARALLHEPELLLFDEPYTGLDARGIATLQTTLTQTKAQGKTVVFTTHDFALGLDLCDRALIFSHGRLVWQSEGKLPSVTEFNEIYHSETQPSFLTTPNAERRTTH
ncbi:MAG: heme ABC exporter ATP-binding protein CcmA [Deltaproteobacteria bacterium]|nr:heme ABC exporter ATP-binding protein CcmA [Deltaproteobacteria bacterium]